MPECNQKGYKDEKDEKISYFNFPTDKTRRKQWLRAIRRDDGKDFRVTEKTKVCSRHFWSSNLKKSLNGRVYVNDNVVPSRFIWCPESLSHLFGVATSTVSRIFTAWVNFMYLKFAQINIWPSREVITKTITEVFKDKYPSTRVIIDCTEIKCEMPSSLLLNTELFSSDKNHTTLKGLIGIAPNGAVTFTSQLYTGSISDREIVIRSGFLAQEFSDGDSVMADKGFTIQDLLPLGTSLNIPPFLGQFEQISPENVIRLNSTNCQCTNSR